MNQLSRLLPPACLPFFLLVLMSIVVTGQTAPADEWQAKFLKQIEELKQQLAEKPDDALAHYKLGGLYQVLYDWQSAAQAYERAAQVKPDFAQAHYQLGWSLGNLGRYEDALRAHQQAVVNAGVKSFKMQLPLAAAHYAVGWDHYNLRRYDEAISFYEEALRADAKYEEASYEIARVRLAQGNREEALRIVQKLDRFFGELLAKEIELTAQPGALRASPTSEPTNRASTTDNSTAAMTRELRPTITYKERAKYTEMARQNRIAGTVVLSVAYFADGRIGAMRVVRGLPYGLTAMALIAAGNIKFTPALKDGQPVSVRGNIEFNFTLY